MVNLFKNFNEYFTTAMNYFFDKVGLGDLNNEEFYQNNLNNFASACYMICYNLEDNIKKINNIDKLKEFKNKFESLIEKSIRKDYDYNDIYDVSEYEMNEFGIDFYECFENNYDNYSINIEEKLNKIKDVINKNDNELKQFCLLMIMIINSQKILMMKINIEFYLFLGVFLEECFQQLKK